MGEVNRWKVTFTKHLKQKRKVYQDGFLDIHRSSNKIGAQALLYDEYEKLLECRLLKQDEVICSGETFIFNAYLVDIDIPQGDHKPESGLNFQANDDKDSEKSGLNLRNNSVFSGKNKSRPTLSPSHKIIREFKKSRLKCYESPQSSSDTRKTMETGVIVEWQVLYTTNITQKAKKYHDGFLKLSICGSLGRQVMLFDEYKKLLDSRFIKKDEIVKSGESIAFDAHLVDIGECERDNKPIDLSQSRNSNVGETRGLHGQKKYFNDYGKATKKEWHVLYTSQITQKSKKYHNGIIRLSSSGSHLMQVTLLNEDKIILSSKHVSLSEDFTTGYVLELPKYLVEVGEACESVQGKFGNNNYNSRKGTSLCISGEDKQESGRETMKKPLRDAREILSILQRPKAAGHADESMRILASSYKVPELSNVEVSDLPKDDLTQKPSENLDMRGSTENAETYTGSGRTLSIDVGIGYPKQLIQSDDVGAESESSLRNVTSGTQSLSDCATCGPLKDEGKRCEESIYEKKIIECPSFDLGI